MTPRTGESTVAASKTTGGELRLTADENAPVAAGKNGAPVSGKVFLTKGMHMIEVKAPGGAFSVERVAFQQGRPITP